MDLLCEQVKMLAGEVALCTSSLKRLSEQATINPGDSQMMVSYLSMFFFFLSLRTNSIGYLGCLLMVILDILGTNAEVKG